MTPATVRRTPLEAAIVDALRYRRAAEALDAEAAQATDAQWRLFYEKKAHAERTMEEYSLQQARDYAAVLLDAESAQ